MTPYWGKNKWEILLEEAREFSKKQRKLSEQNERIFRDMEKIEKYHGKWFVIRTIKFLRDHPERSYDYEDFVPDWKTRVIKE